MDLSQLNVGDGAGEAVRANVTSLRSVGSTTLSVDSIVHWPQKFIATTGTLLPDSTLDPASVTVFSGHINGTGIVIDTFAPGYTDKGSKVNDIVVIKPATAWANTLINKVRVSLNDDGTLKNNIVTGANIANYNVTRSDNGTTTSEKTSVIQSGWVAIHVTVSSSSAAATITFPIPYTNVPIVTVTFGGDTAGNTSTLGSGGANVQAATGMARSVTRTGFSGVANTLSSTATWAVGNTVYLHWVAVGI